MGRPTAAPPRYPSRGATPWRRRRWHDLSTFSCMRAGYAPSPVRQPPQKAAHQPGDIARGLIEREMPGIQPMHLGFGQVFLEGCDLGDVEHRIVAAPHDQGGRPALT